MPGSASPISAPPVRRRRGPVRTAATAVIIGSLALGAAGAGGVEAWTAWYSGTVAVADVEGHLLVSEVMTGGASASDEFIEIYNPTAGTLPLEGLELIYVSASGATVSRKGEWPAGVPGLPPGAHVLVANGAGAFAAVADLTYANGLAATGGSIAIRIRDAATAIDAVGWGTAANAWMEGAAAPAVGAGHSLERLPGGVEGSGQDTDQNGLDFTDRSAPDPQNLAAPPIPISPPPEPSQSFTPSPIATPTATATPTQAPPTQTATPSPTPAPMTVAAARLLPDGSLATVEGVTLTDSTFTDGGGYLADATGGIAVIVSGGAFSRGEQLRVTGVLDDRFHQRTLRADAADVVIIGPGQDHDALAVATGSIDEAVEGQLAAVSATVVSSATALSGGVAFDIDDGSGPTRLVVLDVTGIDHSAWIRGTVLALRGVVGQRDSSGTGTTGYRLLPRATDDVTSVSPPSATPSPTTSPGGSASPSPSEEPGLVGISTAREASINARLRVRGVVTLPNSVLDDGTAAIQDGTGAIILRLGDEAGDLSLGEVVVVDGRRSTKAGMETLQVAVPPGRRGTQAQPAATRHPTGDLGEDQEALLVTVRGQVTITPRRTSAQNVYFDLDDGSGPLRVYISPRTGIDVRPITLGATLELTGVLGQETSGQQPERGHRLWPRRGDDVRIVSRAAPSATGGSSGGPASDGTPGVAGGPGPLGVPAAGGPTRMPDLVVPQLDPARLPRPEPTPTPRAEGMTGLRRASADSPADAAPWLALLAALLGAIGALAAARPGFLDRLRLAVARAAETAADDGPEALREPRDSGPARPGPLEQTVARLVPLAVGDDAALAEHVPSTNSRSRGRRILPPT